MKQISEKSLPKGVKIISIIGIAISAILFFIGIYIIINSFTDQFKAFIGLPIGILIILSSSLTLFFCIFTLKRKNWARIALGIFSLTGGLSTLGFMNFFIYFLLSTISNENSSIVNLSQIIFNILSYISFALMIFIFWYLLFNKKVKEAFA